ncbi:MAG: hypothetical protein IJ491_02975 [Clostridia bacterium]|nr:hypothetical protein [Clostridia bacterium]
MITGELITVKTIKSKNTLKKHTSYSAEKVKLMQDVKRIIFSAHKKLHKVSALMVFLSRQIKISTGITGIIQ